MVMTDTLLESNPLILHASDLPEDVGRALRTAAAIVGDAECADTVLIVVNHTAISGLKTVSASDIPDGVGLVACAAAMRSHQVGEEDIPESVRIVPSGMVFLARMQPLQSGYIRL
jgi:intracellular sulfur oxidation DsrE/DsrF family protein